MKKILAYHFVGKTLRDGRPVPADGETLIHPGKPVMCEQGLHASRCPFDALQYAPGDTLCVVACGGTIIEGDDKLVCTERTIMKRIDAEHLLRRFAADCALAVSHLWDMPPVVREYLETHNPDLRAAARDAARAAARDSARATWAAAWAARATRAAAWAAARDSAQDAAAAARAVRATRTNQRQNFRNLAAKAFREAKK